MFEAGIVIGFLPDRRIRVSEDIHAKKYQGSWE